MKIFCLLLLLLCSMNSMSQEKIPFEIRDGHFYRYGEEIPILSGEMHYARIPHQYWRHRLQMMKGMGLNTVATYVFGISMRLNQENGIFLEIRIWRNI